MITEGGKARFTRCRYGTTLKVWSGPGPDWDWRLATMPTCTALTAIAALTHSLGIVSFTLQCVCAPAGLPRLAGSRLLPLHVLPLKMLPLHVLQQGLRGRTGWTACLSQMTTGCRHTTRVSRAYTQTLSQRLGWLMLTCRCNLSGMLRHGLHAQLKLCCRMPGKQAEAPRTAHASRHFAGTPPPLQPGTSNTTLFEAHAPNPSSGGTPPICLAQLPPVPDGLAHRPGLSEVMAALHSISQHPMMRLLAQPLAATAAAATAVPAAVPTTPLGATPAAAARLHLHPHEEAEEAAADTAAALQALDCADLLPALPPQLGQRQAQQAQQYEAAGGGTVQAEPSATAAGQALEAAFGQRWQLLLEGAADAALACASAGGAKPAVGASEAQQLAGRRTSGRARRTRASSPAEQAGAEAAGQGSGPAGSGGGGGGSQQPRPKSNKQAAAGAAGLPAGRKRQAAEDGEQGAASSGGQQAAAPAAQPKRQRAASAAATAVSAALATTARTVAALLQPLAGGGGPLPLFLPAGAGASRQEKLLLQQQQHLAAQLAVHAAAASLAAAVQRPHAAVAAAAAASRQGAAAAAVQVPHVPPHLTKTSCYR